jgi:ribonuclease HII
MKFKKPKPDLHAEVSLGFLLPKIVIGVDEVGRGCLAGPVVAAAAVLPSDALERLSFLKSGRRSESASSKQSDPNHPYAAILQVKDSKLIAEPLREPTRDAVIQFVRGYAVAEASEAEIGELNILYASQLAMVRAVTALEAQLKVKADAVLVDGHLVPRALAGRGHALVKGDQKSLTIACASIIAKVYRDQLMLKLDAEYPGYGMKVHKGYPTPFHKAKIQELGVSPIHRPGFKL